MWLLLVGCLFALAFPSIVSTETFFEIDPTIVRMMAAALGVAALVMLADHHRLIDLV